MIPVDEFGNAWAVAEGATQMVLRSKDGQFVFTLDQMRDMARENADRQQRASMMELNRELENQAKISAVEMFNTVESFRKHGASRQHGTDFGEAQPVLEEIMGTLEPEHWEWFESYQRRQRAERSQQFRGLSTGRYYDSNAMSSPRYLPPIRGTRPDLSKWQEFQQTWERVQERRQAEIDAMLENVNNRTLLDHRAPEDDTPSFSGSGGFD